MDERRARTRIIAVTFAITFVLTAAALAVGCRRASTPRVTLDDRRQLTFAGNAAYPSISSDGKQLAYVVPRCKAEECAYGIEVQDVGAKEAHEVATGIAVGMMTWTRDRQKLLFDGVAKEGWGTYLVPTGGGTPRKIGPEFGALSPDDDLVLVPSDPGPGADHWIEARGLDGVVRDRIHVAGQADLFQVETVVPNSPWIVVRIANGDGNSELRAIDRHGRQGGSVKVELFDSGWGYVKASSDAVWMQTAADDSLATVVRVPFDARTGNFGSRGDAVYTGDSGGADGIFSVTTDGGTLVLNEAGGEYGAWAMDTAEAFRGAFRDEKRLDRSIAAPMAMRVSPDGKRLLVMRTTQSHSGKPGTTQWTLASFGGNQPETPLPTNGITIEEARWTDSFTVRLRERTAHGTQLALLDVRTNSRRQVLILEPDISVIDFVCLGDGSWAWLSGTGSTIRVQRPGDRIHVFPIPYWRAYAIDASADGKRIAVFGWGQPAVESPLSLGVLSLPDGRFTPWWTTHSGDSPSRASWLPDGSLLLSLWDSPETVSLFRLRQPDTMEKLGTIPRSLAEVTLSNDLRRAAVVTSAFHGDAWMTKVKR